MDRGRTDDERNDRAPSRPRSNVFSDDYEIADSEAVSNTTQLLHNIDTSNDATAPALRTASTRYAPYPVNTIMSRNSTRKSSSYENPFSSPEDNPSTPLNRTPSTRSHFATTLASDLSRRSMSSASSRQFAASDSPRLAASSGPSHPYNMYPQGTVARTPSVATSSTARPVRRSTSLRDGPQHPYGMYTQGVAHSEAGDDEEEQDEDTSRNPVTLGFGLGRPYHRMRGPEGEEQDIIGADGHAEQLPPYSRYPEEGPAKAVMIEVPPTLHSRVPVEGSDPTMPLMHLQQQVSHQSQSMTDASNLESSMPLLGDVGDSIVSHHHNATDATSSVGQKSWKEKTWKERRKTPICGVPFKWILIVLGALCFLFAVLIGSLLGYYAGARHNPGAPSPVTVVTTSLYDASVIATPTNAPPTGTYALTLGTAQAAQSQCLTVPSQQAAWNCNLAGKPAVAMTVGMPPNPTPTNGAWLFYASSDANLSYGAQYSYLETQFSAFLPVQDNDDPNLGPAFFFQQTYDKVVVVPEHAFNISAQRKRYPLSPELEKRNAKPTAGDRPWFCIFNATQLEGFLYIQKPACLDATSSSSITSAAPVALATSNTQPSTTSGPNASNATPTSMTNIAQGLSSAHAVAAAPVAAAAVTHSSSAGAAPPVKAAAPVVPPPMADDTYSHLSPYPYMVKLEERRLANSPAPYCQQYQVLEDGDVNPVADSNGQPIRLNLQESDPPFVAYQSAGLAGNKRTEVPGGCHCQWMHGAPA